MYPITAPLNPDDQGPQVVNLQDGLRRLIDRRIIEVDESMQEQLAQETQELRYGEATKTVVSLFRAQHGLGDAGEVDDQTAELLNNAVSEIGGFDADGGGWNELVGVLEAQTRLLEAQSGTLRNIDTDTDQLGQVSARLAGLADARTLGTVAANTARLTEVDQKLGDIRNVTNSLSDVSEHLEGVRSNTAHLATLGQAFASFATRSTILALGSKDASVADLQAKLVRSGYWIPSDEMESKIFGAGTRTALLRLQERFKLGRTGVLDDASRTALDIAEGIATSSHRIEGRVLFDNGAPAAGLNLRIANKGFGGETSELGVVQTDERGFYALPYEPDGAIANLTLYAVPDDGEPVELTTAPAALPRHAVVAVVAPRALQPLAESEFALLADDLAPHIGGFERLVGAQETGERQDITVLHRASGWDARVIALAARSATLAQASGLSNEAAYGLARTGLPTGTAQLARVPESVVETALHKAVETGVVALSDDAITQAIEQFSLFARQERLNARAPGTLSTLGEMVQISGLNGAEQERLVATLAEPANAGPGLWNAVEADDLLAPHADRLKLQGKLAYLTLNNATVTHAFQQSIERVDGLADHLVGDRLYKPDAWQARLQEIAAHERRDVNTLIPPAYDGDARAYAEDMARKVRISYPTRVIGQLIEDRELPLGDGLEPVRAQVATVLRRAEEQGYALGRASLGATVRDHAERLFAGMDADQTAKTIEATETIHRLYQITPDDEALATLLGAGFTSAQDVASMPYETFLTHYTGPLRTKEKAEIIYRKAQQIEALVYSAFASAKQLDAAVPIFGMAPADSAAQDHAKTALIKHYPTMESLFGSLDFCDCSHCRSVLSPAAYFVDLLQFLDPLKPQWEARIKEWASTHDNAPYPFNTAAEWAAFQAEGFSGQSSLQKPLEWTPYAVLTETRRPDLPVLPLTCENTNVELPYIDVVNEILEFYIQNAYAPGAGAVGDTGDATSAELIAEPHSVLPAVYDGPLKTARYPLSLPFDLWLEMVRRFSDHSGTPFWRLLDAFRRNDALEANGNAFGRKAVFLERLRIAPAEHELLTGSVAWHELYGYPDAQTATDDLVSARTLSRRLGVSYVELDTIVRTWFVNPNQAVMAFLDTLGVELLDILRDRNPGAFTALSADDKAALEDRFQSAMSRYAASGFNAKTELSKLLAAPDFASVLFLHAPPDGCDFGATTLRYADHSDADALAWSRLNLFVRLWRRLGWSIAETDAVLHTVIPASNRPLTASNLGKALDSAMVAISHLEELRSRLGLEPAARPELLSFWADLGTVGRQSPYARRFLTRQARQQDPVFDHPLGRYLTWFDPSSQSDKPFGWNPALAEDVATGNVSLAGHLPALQAALNLSAGDIAQVIQDVHGAGIEAQPLTLANVSALHRYATLAAALNLSVRELIALRSLTLNGLVTPEFPNGIDPFRPLHANPVSALKEDHPYETLRFVEIAALIEESGFTIDELAFLFAHRYDPAGPHRPDVEADRALVTMLLAGIRAIRAEQPAQPPPSAAELQSRLQHRITELLAGETRSDAGLMTLLLTDEVVLKESGNPLIDAFTAVEASGVDLSYFKDAGSRLELVETGISASAATGVVPAGATVARLDGFLEVPSTGVYTLSTLCARQGMTVDLRFSHRQDWFLQGSALADGATIEQEIQLNAGERYRFTLVARGIDTGTVSLRIAGPDLTVRPLERLPLNPALRIERALTLVRKVVRLAQGLALSRVEVGYLGSHGADFGIDFATLPVSQAQSITPSGIVMQFVRLAEYAALKRELGIEGDDLIGLFAAARHADSSRAAIDVLDELYARIADLTRRDPATVRSIGSTLGFTSTAANTASQGTALSQERGVRRLWDALRLTERLGAAPEELAQWATPEPGHAVAMAFRNAIKARHDPAAWQRIARPLFDDLRKLRRDALVQHIMHVKAFDRIEKLYEYFLLDPGMEPVVLTSRLRLAIASVQLFINRCLLNLERMVDPSAINAEHWAWMKRYRVWEANRKIFLYPEYYLEPELRDDKTHAYRELESALLQGDVANDVVENAFYGYLQKLHAISRLDIASIYLQENGFDPAANILHVLGRTANSPRKYFYRRYAHQLWTPWEPVNVDIESNQVAITMWRNRLHLFWLTLIDTSETEEQKKNADAPAAGSGSNEEPEPRIKDTAEETVSEAKPPRRIEVRLNWSEYFQGAWTARASSNVNEPLVFSGKVESSDSGNPLPSMPMHAMRMLSGASEAIEVRLGNPVSKTFRLAGKNVSPTQLETSADPARQPYSGDASHLPRFRGSNTLSLVAPDDDRLGDPTSKATSEGTILGKSGDYELVTLATNPSTLTSQGVPIGPYVSPFFFQDDQHTFFVEPSMTVWTIQEWQSFLLEAGMPDSAYTLDGDYVNDLKVAGTRYRFPKDDLMPHNQRETMADWVTWPGTAIAFGEHLVMEQGGMPFSVVEAGEVVPGNEIKATINPASDLAPGATIVIERNGRAVPIPRGGVLTGQSLSVVGAGGMKPGLVTDPGLMNGAQGPPR